MCDGPGVTPPGLECNPIEQDCPDGEKCIAWASLGGNWDDATCRDIADNPGQVGDACTVEGSAASGIDDCDIGSMCWDVDPETNVGVCVEVCGCSYDQPTCETPNTTCSISNNDSLTLCLPVCNPIDPDACDDGEGCYPVGGFFRCATDVSGDDFGAHGDPCEFINVCDPGTVCVSSAGMPACPAAGCCAQTCDINGGPCPMGTSCNGWYADGEAPDECSETFGVCVP